MSASSASTPRGKLVGEFRIVGLFTSTAYTRSAHSIPYLRRKVAARRAARRLRSRRPFRQGAGQCAGDIIRATSCSRSTRTRSTISRSRSCSSTSGRACACCRGATASTASSRCSFTCRASATTATSAPGDRRLSRRASIKGRVSRLLSVLPGRAAGARAFHHRPVAAARRPIPIARRSEHAVGDDRAHLDRRARARRWRSVYEPDAARALFERYRDAFSRRLSRSLFAARSRSATSASSKGCRRSRPLGVDFHRRPEERATRVGLKVWSFARPIPLSERVPVLENMGFRVVDERTYQIAPARRASQRRLVPRHAARARDGARDRSRRGQAAARSRLPDGDARRRRERRLQRARAGGRADVARRGADPHDLALPAPDPRALFAGLHVGDAGQARRRSPPTSSTVPRPLRSARRASAERARGRAEAEIVAAHRSGAAEGREPRRGPHPAPLRQRGAGGGPHQFLPDRRATASRSR